MKKMIKIILAAVFCLSCLIFPERSRRRLVAVADTDFSKNEEYYYQLCSSSGLSDAEKNLCKDFRDYLEKKQSDLEAEIKRNQNNLATLKANIASELAQVNKIAGQVSSVEKSIKLVEQSITKVEANISALNLQIEEREGRISDLNEQIKARMMANQKNMTLNLYVQLIMEADSFIDMLRTFSGLNSFTDYDSKKIGEINHERELLQADKSELASQKDDLEQRKSELSTLKKNLVSLKAQHSELLAAYRAKKSQLEKSIDSKLGDVSALSKAMEEIDKALDGYYASSKWGKPLKTSYYVSSGCYYYTPNNPNSGFHPAVDLAGKYGSSVYAVANGYVVDIHTGCPYGYLGSNCGNGHGNYVLYVVQVGKVTYEVIAQHLSAVNVKVGDLVTQGSTVIGKIGSSGNSSGAHLHLGIIKMGTNLSIKQAVRKFKDKNNYYFGAVKKISGACYYRGGAAPCFENPMEIYNLTYHKWY
ncbi:MAG: peptidoglycan DD-metalloendopeptidase family protein [Erysipelotrichaceae bacterium]|nr:peptidoglycan DD-metalloendopeptidase family protein [Erysipelotrichaceae bacterium]MBQ4252090.1 peptidoglycan DD-metalloendopeptidase family protein [Erysipelotrichaceae bacterium]